MENIIVNDERVEETTSSERPSTSTSIFDKVSYYLLLALTFLMPIFFIPSTSVPYDLSKSVFIAAAILGSFVCYAIARFKDGRISVPKSAMFVSAILLAAIYFVSALISSNTGMSLMGQGFELGTVSNIALMVLLMFLTATLSRDSDRIVKFYMASIGSFVILALFHALRFAFPGSMSLGLLGDNTANLVGKWNDLGIYFGMIGLLSFVTLTYLNLSKGIKALLYVASVVAFIFFAIVNFTLAWYAVAIVAVLVFLAKFLRADHAEGAKRTISVFAIVLFVLSLIFIGFGDKLISPVSTKLGVGQLEVRPSWSATLDIYKNGSKVFGSGPNRFVNEYYKSKPTDINSTIFWNAGFLYGIGLIPTYMITTGVIGILAWLLFLGFFIYKGIRAMLSRTSNPALRYVTASSFLVGLYLWFLSVVYVPSMVITTFAFIFTGIFLGALILEGRSKVWAFTFTGQGVKRSIVSMVALTGVVAASFVWFYSYGSRLVAGIYFNDAVATYGQSRDIVKTEESLLKAIDWKENSVYYQSLVELAIQRMGEIIASSKDLKDQTVVAQLQALLAYANGNAERALAYDQTDYQNWVTKAHVAESVLPLGVQDAYETAINSYKKAIEQNPTNPALYLMVARVEASAGKYEDAKKSILEAVKLKNNYTEAIFFLAQVQVAEGNLKEAIRSAQVAVQVSPNDAQSYYLLGLLLYNDKNYTGTVQALAKAVELNNQYSNARYFLGLSLARLGKMNDALAQFEEIQKLNPDNAEVASIVSNLRAGKSPLAEAVTTAPEKRTKPPVKDGTEKKATASLKTTAPAKTTPTPTPSADTTAAPEN